MEKESEELVNLLNSIVDTPNGIDAVFVYDLKNGFLHYSSSTNKGRDSTLVEKLSGKSGSGSETLSHMDIFGEVRKEMDVFGNETGHDALKSIILQFEKGIVFLYVYFPKKDAPTAIGFVNTKNKGDTLGRMVYFCETNIDNVKEKLKPLLEL